MKHANIILGIESSCDETSVALVDSGRHILGMLTWSQIQDHVPYKGIVPELASRKHLEIIDPLLEKLFSKHDYCPTQLYGIAFTSRPGLVGALAVGMCMAKTLALIFDKPIVGINHIEGHAYAIQLEKQVPYPHLVMILSGGHTIFFNAIGPTQYQFLGGTTDDAIGEAFDKVASNHGLQYPGGATLSHMAKQGNPNAFAFPKPKYSQKVTGNPYPVSYSGLKTATIHYKNKHRKIKEKSETIDIFNLFAAFEKTAIEIVMEQMERLCHKKNVFTVVVGGGVAQNQYLRRIAKEHPKIQFHFPSPSLCSDNASMIAGLGYHVLQNAKKNQMDLDVSPSFQ